MPEDGASVAQGNLGTALLLHTHTVGTHTLLRLSSAHSPDWTWVIRAEMREKEKAHASPGPVLVRGRTRAPQDSAEAQVSEQRQESKGADTAGTKAVVW